MEYILNCIKADDNNALLLDYADQMKLIFHQNKHLLEKDDVTENLLKSAFESFLSTSTPAVLNEIFNITEKEKHTHRILSAVIIVGMIFVIVGMIFVYVCMFE